MDLIDIAVAKKLAGGGGGSSLPEATAADEGKVLTVNDGQWAAETPCVVNLKGIITDYLPPDEYTPETYYVTMEGEETMGARYNEIVQLGKSGTLVFFSISLYIKNGQLDPTGTGDLVSIMRFYPYGTNNSEWRTFDNTVKLTGTSLLWAIGAPQS